MTMKRNGFTLIELLTVLAVLAIVTTIGVDLFFRVGDEWRLTSLRMDLQTKADKIFESMGKDINQVVSAQLSGWTIRGEQRSQDMPLAPRGQGKERERAFQRVEDDRLILPVESKNPQTGRTEHINVMYSIDRSDKVPALVRTLGKPGAEPPAGAKETIEEGVTALCFEFSDGSNWVPHWNQTTLPKSVRVNLMLVDKNRQNEQIARKETFTVHVK
jgi:type II secretion system protein J